ncbi:AroM family protein [Acetobacteraceae bacterium H6797]|nr:AroM family protein [Acetobacteraceae bacterium H6797]
MSERILVINPNSDTACTAGIATAIAPLTAPGLPRFDVVTLAEGPPAIKTWRDWFSVAEPLCRMVEREEAAAYVIACVSDPAVDLLRTVTARPVFGPFRSAVATALTRGERFGVIAFVEASKARQRKVLQSMGVEARLAASEALDLPMSALTDPEAPRLRLAEVAKNLVAQGAETVVLGCAGMAGHRAYVEDACGVPVIEPCQAAASQALLAVITAR